jgi:predicted metalloprotease
MQPGNRVALVDRREGPALVAASSITGLRPLLALLCLAILLAGAPGASAQDAVRSADAVTATAIAQSRQLEHGNVSAVYDRVHPDVRNLVPRGIFAGWIAASGSGVPLADPVITGVAFAPWTSLLTGETYPVTASATFTQVAIRDGVAVDVTGTWRFLHDGDRWRWLPDIDPADLAVLAAEEAGAPGAYLPSFRQAVYVRIDRFWQAEFFRASRPYVPLDIVTVTADTVDTGCGTVSNVRQIAIFYCVYDATVYVDPRFRDQVTGESGAFAWTTVIAHEWGHHVQAQLGIDIAAPGQPGLTPLDLELQADCLAAIYVQDAFARGHIAQDEVDAARDVLAAAGDPPGTDPGSPAAHGTAAERIDQFEQGFDSGFTGCSVSLRAAA